MTIKKYQFQYQNALGILDGMPKPTGGQTLLYLLNKFDGGAAGIAAPGVASRSSSSSLELGICPSLGS
jgi:hypothetical protein